MNTLRIFEAGKGDCLALRRDGKTLFIFDTGTEKSYSRSHGGESKPKNFSANGFGLALEQALNKGAGEPPTVIISHVDSDHIGGLMAWVKDVLSRSQNWAQANMIAKNEISQVWCNVPTEVLAWNQNSELQILLEQSAYTLGHGSQKFDIALEPEDEINVHEHSPHQIIRLLQKRQRAIQELLEYNKALSRAEGRDEVSAGDSRQHDLSFSDAEGKVFWQWLRTAYPNQKDFFERFEENGRWWSYYFSTWRNRSWIDLDIEGEGTLKLFLEEIFLDADSYDGLSSEINIGLDRYDGGSCRSSFRMNIEKRSHRVDSSRKHELWKLIFPFHQEQDNERCRGIRLRFDFRLSAEPSKDFSYDRAFNKIRKTFHAAELSDSVPEFVSEVLAVLDEFYEPNEELLEISAILRLLLGVTAIDNIDDKVALFSALKRLGVRLIGDRVEDYFFRGSNNEVELQRLAYDILTPNLDQLKKLQDGWENYSRSLDITPEFRGGAVMRCLTAPYASRWSPDRSPKNMSSIALWIRHLGSDACMILTGDALHRQVMEGLADLISKRTWGRKVYYQLPHHGGARNTNTDSKYGDELPGDLLCGGRKIRVGFATGGLQRVIRGKGPGPRKEVVDYFASGTRGTIAVREAILESNEDSSESVLFFDIEIP